MVAYDAADAAISPDWPSAAGCHSRTNSRDSRTPAAANPASRRQPAACPMATRARTTTWQAAKPAATRRNCPLTSAAWVTNGASTTATQPAANTIRPTITFKLPFGRIRMVCPLG